MSGDSAVGSLTGDGPAMFPPGPSISLTDQGRAKLVAEVLAELDRRGQPDYEGWWHKACRRAEKAEQEADRLREELAGAATRITEVLEMHSERRGDHPTCCRQCARVVDENGACPTVRALTAGELTA